MPDIETLSHTKWDGKYHIVFIPKYRRKALYTELRRHLGEVFRSLAEQRECRIEEGHLMPDHVHRLLSIPPKYSVAQVVGFIKGKSAIHMARTFMGRRKNYTGHHFWARGYYLNVARTKSQSPYELYEIRVTRHQVPARACRSSSL